MRILCFICLFFTLTADILAQELSDIKPPIDPPADLTWLIVFLALMTGTGLFFVLRKLFKRSPQNTKPKEPPQPPHVVALKRLADLQNRRLPDQGLLNEFFVGLSDIVRRYIEDRFEIKAAEMTTDEFLEYIRASDILETEHKQLLKEFLGGCDLVKFAKYGPDRREIENSFESARRFVEETKPLKVAAE